MQKEIKKCGCSGCKNQSVLTIKQNFGQQQFLPMCADHAPQWAKDGKKESPPAQYPEQINATPGDWAQYRKELIQVAAVCVAAISNIPNQNQQ